MSVLRYGVLSTAQIARIQHIPAAAEADNSQIVAIASRDAGRARQVAGELGIDKACGSYEELLDDPEIDAILNPLPNSLHAEWSIRAAEPGKHVLCEKPLAPTPEACRRMIDAAEANGVLLYEGFTQHWNPLMDRLRELIAGGALGEITHMRSELTYTLPDWKEDARGQAGLDGGALLDAGCYAVNNVRTLMGVEPTQAIALQRIHADNGVESTFTGLLSFPGGRLAHIVSGMEQPFRCILEVVGTDGSAMTPNFFSGKELTVTAGGKTTVETFDAVNRFALQLQHFSDCVLGGADLRARPIDGLRNAAALVALKTSADTGRAMDV